MLNYMTSITFPPPFVVSKQLLMSKLVVFTAEDLTFSAVILRWETELVLELYLH